MAKQIVVIGGGISGLAVLHYLKQKNADRTDLSIRLLEKNDYLGGTIRTDYQDGYVFENGPNGFLDSKETTLTFIRELGLDAEILRADPQAKRRFLSVGNRLYELPATLRLFLGFPLLNLKEKLQVLAEVFRGKGRDPNETVYEFGSRRLGRRFSGLFLDAMVTGIFAGDIRQLNLKNAFPRIYELEQKYGSLFRALVALKKEKRRSQQSAPSGQPAGTLTSFRKGMFQLIHTLHALYKDSIFTGQEARSVSLQGAKWRIETERPFDADELFVCVPAYSAAQLLQGYNAGFADNLRKIVYAPVAVVGLVYDKKAFKTLPQGFGYLNPSSQGKEVLGVLFTGNIFTNRCGDDEFFMRVMMGGSLHPDVFNKTDQQLIDAAHAEVQTMLEVKADPKKHFLVKWSRAIPQYTTEYTQIKQTVLEQLRKERHLHLVANYLGGISLNDCISNAKDAVSETDF